MAAKGFHDTTEEGRGNIHRMAVPAEIRGQKYISLATFRKNGVAVRTPIWRAEKQ